ncbi:MAG: selenocysteine-specific translation elongation factor, partial [Gammaproteobacteria bacterium]
MFATAGHVDHGKTSLVRQLTGTDTDTLAEEKQRGLTINLGFAYHQFTNEQQPGTAQYTLGFVDVPGHRDFINNMLAGVGSVDSALLIVAADDGIMPQTREHLAILHLLSISICAVVITKIDRVETATLTTLAEQIESLLDQFDIAEVPMFRVCAITGEGIDLLRVHLYSLAMQQQVHSAELPGTGFRYLVDRSFSVTGIGTVVTGSVRAGDIRTGANLVHSPSTSQCRIKGMRIHKADVTELFSGNRAALNINLPWQSIERGDWLLESEQPAHRLRFDARLRLLDKQSAIRSSAQYHLFIGASHHAVNLRWLDETKELAQVKLNSPIHLCCGDRFIVRDPAATQTLGGGHVIDINVPRRGRSSVQRIDFLVRADNPPLEALRMLLPSLEFGLSLDEFLASRNLKSHSLNYIYRELEQSGVNFEKLNVKFAINPWLMDGKVYAQHRARILEQL